MNDIILNDIIYDIVYDIRKAKYDIIYDIIDISLQK